MDFLDSFCSKVIPTFVNSKIFQSHSNDLIKILFRIISDYHYTSGIEINFNLEPKLKKNSSEMTAPVDSLIGMGPKADYLVDKPILLDFSDISAPLKPNLVSKAQTYVFHICSSAIATEKERKIGQMVVPMLIEHSKSIFEKYTAMKPKIGRFPYPKFNYHLTRSKSIEIITILEKLRDLILPSSKVSPDNEPLNDLAVKKYLKECSIGHLFQLFGPLTKLYGVVSGSVFYESTNGAGAVGGDEIQIADLTRECLAKMGDYFTN